MPWLRKLLSGAITTLIVMLVLTVIFLALTVIDKGQSFTHIVFERGIYLTDIIYASVILAGPVIIFTLAMRDASYICTVGWALIAAAAITGYLSYYTYPEVREKRVLSRCIDAEQALRDLKEAPDAMLFGVTGSEALAEAELYHRINQAQWEFLSREKFRSAARAKRPTIFFGALSILALTFGISTVLWSISKDGNR